MEENPKKRTTSVRLTERTDSALEAIRAARGLRTRTEVIKALADEEVARMKRSKLRKRWVPKELR